MIIKKILMTYLLYDNDLVVNEIRRVEEIYKEEFSRKYWIYWKYRTKGYIGQLVYYCIHYLNRTMY